VPASSGYLLRETGGNLKRNVVMTVAAIVTMAVSLTAVAAVLLMRQEVNKQSVQWRGGVELAIFMSTNATQAETEAVASQLRSMPEVKSFHYVDQPQAYQEFKTLFAGDPGFVNVVHQTDLPTSFRVVPQRPSQAEVLGNQFKNQPGVTSVAFAQQEINELLSHFRSLRLGAYILAGLVMLGAVALIVNTIQLAIFARRREVAVMKLVGATNWFIRIPFMIEGLIEGLIGALIASAIAFQIRNHMSWLISGNVIGLNQHPLYSSTAEAVWTGLVVLAIGAGVGVLGSAFAIRRFLAV
jgi:cell division transport system permease protein